MKVGQDFGEKINQKTFLLHFLKLNFLMGAGGGELSLARRGHNKILTRREVILEGFLMDPVFTPPPQIVCHTVVAVMCVCVSSTIQGQGHGGLGSLQGGSVGKRGPGRAAPAAPAQPRPVASAPAWAIQPKVE